MSPKELAELLYTYDCGTAIEDGWPINEDDWPITPWGRVNDTMRLFRIRSAERFLKSYDVNKREKEKGVPQGSTSRTPKVGDDIIYYAYGTPGGEFPVGVPRAAKVTEVLPGFSWPRWYHIGWKEDPDKPGYLKVQYDGKDEPDGDRTGIDLVVFNPSGLFFNRNVHYGTSGGNWSWPEDVR
jgi:hypothetical protein